MSDDYYPDSADKGLFDLLLRALPDDSLAHTEHRSHTANDLAELVGVNRQTVYKWLRKGRVVPDVARQIVGVSDERVKLEDFHPYVYGTNTA